MFRLEMFGILIFITLLSTILCVNETSNTVTVKGRDRSNATIRITYPPHIQKQFKKLIFKPKLPYGPGDRQRAPFHPAWMDYCDPYHCGDYFKTACGLNRKNMKFRYFQSGCHLILNNMCATYRGALKYDMVELKFCRAYNMFLRMSCPSDCGKETVDPVCAYSTTRGQVVLFVNKCYLEAANCRNSTIQEFETVNMRVCEQLLLEEKAKLRSDDYNMADI